MCISPKTSLSIKQPAKLKVFGVDDQQYQSILKDSNDNVERLQLERLKAFLDKEPEFHVDMEINHLGYSEHLFEFKLGLKQLSANETRKISSTSKILIDELAAACLVMELPVETRQFRRLYFVYASQQASRMASVHPIRRQTNGLAQAAYLESTASAVLTGRTS